MKLMLENNLSQVLVAHSGIHTGHADRICLRYVIQQGTLLRMQYAYSNTCRGAKDK